MLERLKTAVYDHVNNKLPAQLLGSYFFLLGLVQTWEEPRNEYSGTSLMWTGSKLIVLISEI